jgi:hypothetical protein
MPEDVSPQRADIARDRGLARLRRFTGAALAAAVGLSAVFAGAAASSTHPRRPVRTTRVRSTRHVSTTPALPPAQAPSLSGGDDGAPSPSPTPPASPPAPTASPPVAVSGGS